MFEAFMSKYINKLNMVFQNNNTHCTQNINTGY
jgi:hypothetical protein